MVEVSAVLLDLFIIFAAAKVAAEVFERLRQPAVIGELLVGILIGPYALGLIGLPAEVLVEAFHSEATAGLALQTVYQVLAQLGVIFLLFLIGLETRASDLFQVGGRAMTVAVLGVIVPFALGFVLILALGHGRPEAIFVGAAMVATSVGITARVLRDMDVLHSREARIILGAAVIDDILGILVLTMATGLGTGRGLSPWGILILTVQVAAFTLFLMFVGTRIVRRYSVHLESLRIQNAPFVVGVLVCLGLAALAGYIGLAAIIGAFMAGMVLAETRERYRLEHHTMPVYEFLVPFFFVITGSMVDWRVFLQADIMGLAGAVVGLAVLGKLVGCGLGGWGMGPRSALILGVGMVPRGEVGLIVASIGRSLGAMPEELFTVVVIMSVVTTLIIPPVLKLLYAGYKPAAIVTNGGEEAPPLKEEVTPRP